MQSKKSYELLLGGLFLALALGLPPAFHLFGSGSSFLPMFYPVLLAGFLLQPRVSLPVGVLSPILSAALTGMPPFFPPVAFIMVAEFSVMNLLAWVFFQRLKWPIYLSLFISTLAERLTLLFLTLILAEWFKVPGIILGPITLLKGLPGLLIIFLIVPPLVLKIRENLRLSPFLQEFQEDFEGHNQN